MRQIYYKGMSRSIAEIARMNRVTPKSLSNRIRRDPEQTIEYHVSRIVTRTCRTFSYYGEQLPLKVIAPAIGISYDWLRCKINDVGFDEALKLAEASVRRRHKSPRSKFVKEVVAKPKRKVCPIEIPQYDEGYVIRQLLDSGMSRSDIKQRILNGEFT